MKYNRIQFQFTVHCACNTFFRCIRVSSPLLSRLHEWQQKCALRFSSKRIFFRNVSSFVNIRSNSLAILLSNISVCVCAGHLFCSHVLYIYQSFHSFHSARRPNSIYPIFESSKSVPSKCNLCAHTHTHIERYSVRSC